MLRKIARAYSGAALLLLNTLLFLLLLNLALGAYYWWSDGRSVEAATPYSQYFKLKSYTRVDQETATAVGREFDRMGERESYQFHPWVGFVEGGFEGRFVNVSPDGVRRTPPPAPPADAKEDFVVWMFGGSTTFGWGMPDSETVPAHFQRELQRLLPSNRVRVVNLGHAYYSSPQEVALLLAELRRSVAPPQLVTVLNGLNDASLLARGRVLPPFAEISQRGWTAERAERYATRDTSLSARLRWFELKRAFPMLRLAQGLRGESDVVVGRTASKALPVNGRYAASRRPVRSALRNHQLNRSVVADQASRVGALAVQFLQPVPGVGESRAKTGSLDKAGVAFYRALLAPGADPLGEDLHAVLKDLEHPYVDQHHYSDEGSQVVAAAMAEIVVERLQER